VWLWSRDVEVCPASFVAPPSDSHTYSDWSIRRLHIPLRSTTLIEQSPPLLMTSSSDLVSAMPTGSTNNFPPTRCLWAALRPLTSGWRWRGPVEDPSRSWAWPWSTVLLGNDGELLSNFPASLATTVGFCSCCMAITCRRMSCSRPKVIVPIDHTVSIRNNIRARKT